MGKIKIPKALKNADSFITKHSPEILMGIGIAGMVTTTVLAVKATPKALKMIEERKENDFPDQEKLPPVELVKTCWKCYLPATITGAASVACLIGSNSVSNKRTAVLAAAYQISETAFADYREKVVETIGEKKEQTVKDKISEKQIAKNPVSGNEVIITKAGNTLCYDTLSGRYFKSDIDKIKKAVNELNRRMTYDVYVSLNEFYDELDIDHTAIGDDLGWNLDNGLIEISFGSQIADDGTPCIVLNYCIAPRYDYSRFF